MKIVPTLIAKNQKELNFRFNKLKYYFDTFQIDVMDGRFVSNKSMDFNFKLPKDKIFEAHLMIQNPTRWILKNSSKVDIIIFHIESVNKEEVLKVIKEIKKKRKKVGIAINPNTPINTIIPYLSKINLVLLMSVNPGKYGSKFISSTLTKAKELKKIKKRLVIEIDGGINPQNIKKALQAGVFRFAVGSYLQKNKDIIKAKHDMKI